MRSLISILILSLCLTANATRQRTHRMSDGSVLTFKTRAESTVRKMLPMPYTNWDPEKKYRLPVILMSFADCDFAEGHNQEFYNDLFNKEGFNLRSGLGCIKEYFRDQSRGNFNVEFDVVGPFKLTTNQKSKSDDNFGMTQFIEVIKAAADELNYADYDWDGNKKVETVIIVFAGYGGNEEAEVATGCIWPNTDYVNFDIDGIEIGCYSASPELWSTDALCGIGTICHELSHVFGLPDIYPVNSSEFSVCDEWDLMDGGNFADDGWCPPNYSIQERELLGWQKAEELTEFCNITDMPSYSSSGKAYRVANAEKSSESYYIENRQWEGWDYMLPGHGLLITYVDFDESWWLSNQVNSRTSHHRYDYLHADGLDYNYFDELYDGLNPYGKDGRNLRLANTAYPYTDPEGVVHNEVELFKGLSITEIAENEGVISYKYSDVPVGIASVTSVAIAEEYYDLQGRKLPSLPSSGVYIVKYSNGTVKKIMR